MVDLKVTLSNEKGANMTLEQVYTLVVHKKFERPADSISTVFEGFLPDSAYTKIKVVYQSRTVFDGVIDSFEQVFEEGGTYTKIEGRSKVALLLDREAKPAVFFSVTLQQIFSTYVQPHSFSTNLSLTTSLTDFVVSKGVSCWDAVELFCIHAFSKKPRLIHWNTITTSYDNNPLTFEINNTETSVYPFSSVRKKRDYSGLITKVYVKNEISYSKTYNNTKYGNELTKERYLDPNMRWFGREAAQAGFLMEQSNLRDNVLILNIPQLTQIEIGSILYFTDTPHFNRKKYKVIEVREEVETGKVETKVYAREES